jgi:hypothetical protein
MKYPCSPSLPPPATAVGLALLDVVVDGLESFLVDDGAHARRLFGRVADLQLIRARDDALDDRLVRVADDYRARAGRTLLPLESERRLHDSRRSFVQIHIRVNDYRVLAAHLCDDALDPDLPVADFRRALIDAKSDLLRACERDVTRQRMVNDYVADFAA